MELESNPVLSDVERERVPHICPIVSKKNYSIRKGGAGTCERDTVCTLAILPAAQNGSLWFLRVQFPNRPETRIQRDKMTERLNGNGLW